jgi:hypothetical protein
MQGASHARDVKGSRKRGSLEDKFETPKRPRPDYRVPGSATVARKRGPSFVKEVAAYATVHTEGTSDAQFGTFLARRGPLAFGKSVDPSGGKKELDINKRLLTCHAEHPFQNVLVPIQVKDGDIMMPCVDKLLKDIPFEEMRDPWSVWLDAVLQILTGIEEIHSRLRIAHRDLKPDNIGVYHQAGIFKIFDFGVSAELESMQEPAGAPYYNPPSLNQLGWDGEYKVDGSEDFYAVHKFMNDLLPQRLKQDPKAKAVLKFLDQQNVSVDGLLAKLAEHGVNIVQVKDSARHYWQQHLHSQTERFASLELPSRNSESEDEDFFNPNSRYEPPADRTKELYEQFGLKWPPN